jgi:hypothetical protein
MYNSGNSSKNVTGSAIVDGTVEAADLATAVNNDIADGVAGKATADLALPKAGGAMTGTITNFTSTGIDDSSSTTKVITITDTATSFPSGHTIKLPGAGKISNGGDSNHLGEVIPYDSAGCFTFNRYWSSGGSYKFKTDNVEKMRLDSSGNFGVSAIGGLISAGAGSTGLWWAAAGNNYLTIARSSSSAALHINKTNSDTTNNGMISFKLDGAIVGGDIDIDSGAVRYNTTSDYRLKENLTPMSGSINRLKSLKPCNFNFITNPEATHDGFIAHEVQDVVSGAVSGIKDGMVDIGNVTDIDGSIVQENVERPSDLEDGQIWNKTGQTEDYQGIDQSKLVPLLVSALQEAITRIEQLENN